MFMRSENEFELNKTYAFDTVAFSQWLVELRKAVLEDTLKKINEDTDSLDKHGGPPDAVNERAY